jgi:DNA-binding response OmpR family regulator
VWGRTLRDGDRSIDVYVHKLRSKLEGALPGWRFIHTHVGFGYRFTPERSHPLHTT